jgi:hypothetical protein
MIAGCHAPCLPHARSVLSAASCHGALLQCRMRLAGWMMPGSVHTAAPLLSSLPHALPVPSALLHRTATLPPADLMMPGSVQCPAITQFPSLPPLALLRRRTAALLPAAHRTTGCS